MSHNVEESGLAFSAARSGIEEVWGSRSANSLYVPCSRIESPGHCMNNYTVQPTCDIRIFGIHHHAVNHNNVHRWREREGKPREGEERGKDCACRTLTETSARPNGMPSAFSRRSYFFLSTQRLLAIITSPTPLPTVPSPFPRFRGLHSYLLNRACGNPFRKTS